MQSLSPIPRLTDIVEAITHIRAETAGVPLDVFEADRRKRWPVERGTEIISEASRQLPDELAPDPFRRKRFVSRLPRA